MGGRGGASGFSWQRQLKQMAKQGKMPAAIVGNRDAQAQIFTEIDKLYTMPQTNATIVDQGDGVWVNFNGRVSRSGYPSGDAASDAEKRGVLKWKLWRMQSRNTP